MYLSTPILPFFEKLFLKITFYLLGLELTLLVLYLLLATCYLLLATCYIGAIIQSSLTKEQSTTHAALLSQLTTKASTIVQTLDVDDELTFLRLRSKNKEIMVAPDKEFLMVVIQNPNSMDSASGISE